MIVASPTHIFGGGDCAPSSKRVSEWNDFEQQQLWQYTQTHTGMSSQFDHHITTKQYRQTDNAQAHKPIQINRYCTIVHYCTFLVIIINITLSSTLILFIHPSIQLLQLLLLSLLLCDVINNQLASDCGCNCGWKRKTPTKYVQWFFEKPFTDFQQQHFICVIIARKRCMWTVVATGNLTGRRNTNHKILWFLSIFPLGPWALSSLQVLPCWCKQKNIYQCGICPNKFISAWEVN